MTTCDDVLAAVLLGDTLDDAGRQHAATCERCRRELDGVRKVSARLAAWVPEEPSPALGHAVLRAAAPILAQARRARWRDVARAVAAALVPLPLVVVFDVLLVRRLHAALAVLLPAGLSAYLVFNYAAMLAVLVALTYAAVPLLAERQARGRWMELHA
jgi:hypothetical protein